MTAPIEGAMRLLFITAHKYLPQMRGGLQSSTDQLCSALAERGHRVAVLAGLMPGGFFGAKCRIKMKINQILSGCQVTKETALTYPVWYSWFPWDAVSYVVQKEKPDLIVVLQHQSIRMALAVRQTGISLLMHFADVEFHELGGDLRDLGRIPCVANSHFTAAKYRSAYGVNPDVIYHIISPSQYRTPTTKANVTFINPHPKKGRDIAIAIAQQCPEIPFTFLETWPLESAERQELSQKLASLPNVSFCGPQKDMRQVYAQCRILLVPSIWEEAYGRVATEAQINGIPVIGSTRGGLPEAIGPGGIVLDPNQPIADWAAAVRKLWQDQRYYNKLSAAALSHSQRPEITFPSQIETWERVLSAAAQFNQICPAA